MNAKYYRFLYQSAQRGMCFSACLAKEAGEPQFYAMYLGASAQTEDAASERKEGPAGRTRMEEHPGARLQILVLGDLLEDTLARAERIIQTTGADTVYMPRSENRKDGETPASRFGKLKGTHVVEVEHTLKLQAGEICLRLISFKEKLVMYLGSTEVTPNTHECVMYVKGAAEDMNCSPLVDVGNLNCEMRCLLCQDVTQCKKQNRSRDGFFADGHLLTGTAKLGPQGQKLRESLKDVWERIRFVWMPCGGKQAAWADELSETGTLGCRQYFLGAKSADAEVMQKAAKSVYRGAVLIGDGESFCISGCYAER
ncbi:MAG: hypothetical protein Q4C50_09605 [Eubacteriales bacterium]|nr:hypothetical protein [Eubacteriales bacterium]